MQEDYWFYQKHNCRRHGTISPCRAALEEEAASLLPGARGQQAALWRSTMTKEGEEGASLCVVALVLTVGGCGGVSVGNEVGGSRAAVGVREPA